MLQKIDHLGRIVIPKETRRIFDITEKDPLEIFVERETIILQKYKPYGICLITGENSS